MNKTNYISIGKLTKKETMKFTGLGEDEFEEGLKSLVDKGLLEYYIRDGYIYYTLYPLDCPLGRRKK